MRATYFIGVKTANPAALFLIENRFRWRWMAQGGRVVRKARAEDGVPPDRHWWCTLNKAVKPEPESIVPPTAVAAAEPLQAVAAAPSGSGVVHDDAGVIAVAPKRKRGRPRKVRAE